MMRAEKTIRKFNSVARGRCLLDQVRIMPAKLPLSGPPPLFLRPRNLRRFYDPLSSLRVILFHALAITLASHQREEELFTEENSSIFESIFWESLRNSRVLLVFVEGERVVERVVLRLLLVQLERIRILLVEKIASSFWIFDVIVKKRSW